MSRLRKLLIRLRRSPSSNDAPEAAIESITGRTIYYAAKRDWDQMNAIPDDLSPDGQVVLMAAFGISARMRFPDEASRREIAAFSQKVLDNWPDEEDRMSAHDMTTMIAQELINDSGPSVDAFHPQEMANAWIHVIINAAFDLKLTDEEIAEVVCGAETVARQWGWSPPLLSTER